MAVRYRNRERRLERNISRIETARQSIARQTETALERELWWRRHGATLEDWRRAIAERRRRGPSQIPQAAAGRFRQWSTVLRWHPRVLRLRIQCWWLTVLLGLRGLRRGPRS
jgi:hypothetical protein